MADIDLLFGVAMGGASGDSAKTIADQLNSIIKGIEPLKVRVEVDIDGSSGKWKSDLEKLVGTDGKSINIKIAKIDSSGAMADFKSDLEKIVNSISIDKGVKIDVKGLDVGDIATDLKQVGNAAKDSTSDIDRLNAEIKELKTQAASITSAYKSITNTTAKSVNGVQVDEIKSKYIELQTEIEAMNREGATSTNAHIAKVRELETEMRKLLQTAQKTGVNFGPGSDANQKALTKVNNLIADITKNQREWTKAQNGMSSGSYQKLTGYVNDLKEMASALRDGKMTQAEFAKSFDLISSGVKSANKEIKAAGEATKSWSDRMGGLVKKFSQWFSVSQAIMFAINSVKQMVTTVIELDTAMTELKKVTDETDATYERFLTNAVSRAKNVGASLSDMVNATADFARLGYNIDDASQLADTATIYKNVADGISDISEASESIISTMQAFGIEANNAMTIVDKFNNVSNNFAISSAGLGESLQRSAAAMHSANNTLDQTIALTTAANTVVQNPMVVGTTLKTVSLYLRAAKTEAEEAGESTDGMAESVSELRQEILDLTGQKVDIQIDSENFKSTYDILKELAAVWDDLTDVSQANILELIGGKRNANVVSSLLENFELAENVLKTSADSAGSALAENEKYLDSIQGKISQFQAAWQAMSSTIVNSDLVKIIISVGTSIVEAATTVIDAISSLSVAVSAIPIITMVSQLGKVQTAFGKLSGTIQSFAGGAKRCHC